MLPSAVYRLHRLQWMPLGLGETFALFERPENLALITPPWLELTVLTPGSSRSGAASSSTTGCACSGCRRDGARRSRSNDPPFGFRDEQVVGRYRARAPSSGRGRWDHRHRVRSERGGTAVEDDVDCEVPLGLIGMLVHRLAVRQCLDEIFEFRRLEIERLRPPEAGAPAI